MYAVVHRNAYADRPWWSSLLSSITVWVHTYFLAWILSINSLSAAFITRVSPPTLKVVTPLASVVVVLSMCVCECVYIYIHIHIHTGTRKTQATMVEMGKSAMVMERRRLFDTYVQAIERPYSIIWTRVIAFDSRWHLQHSSCETASKAFDSRYRHTHTHTAQTGYREKNMRWVGS